MFKRFLTAPFRFVWWVVTLPFRLLKKIINVLLYPFGWFGRHRRYKKLLKNPNLFRDVLSELEDRWFSFDCHCYSRVYSVSESCNISIKQASLLWEEHYGAGWTYSGIKEWAKENKTVARRLQLAYQDMVGGFKISL